MEVYHNIMCTAIGDSIIACKHSIITFHYGSINVCPISSHDVDDLHSSNYYLFRIVYDIDMIYYMHYTITVGLLMICKGFL